MTTLDDLIKDDFDANEHDAFPDEGSISGDPRTEARLLALQAIFQHVFVDITVIVGFEFVPFSADRDSVSIFSSCVDRN